MAGEAGAVRGVYNQRTALIRSHLAVLGRRTRQLAGMDGQGYQRGSGRVQGGVGVDRSMLAKSNQIYCSNVLAVSIPLSDSTGELCSDRVEDAHDTGR